MRGTFRTFGLLGLVAALGTAGCSSDLTQPESPEVASLNTVTHDAKVRLVKLGPAGSTATFSVSATGGNVLHQTITLDACQQADISLCPAAIVWEATDAELVNVTITETGFTGAMELERIMVFSELLGTTVTYLNPAEPRVTVEGARWNRDFGVGAHDAGYGVESAHILRADCPGT